MKHLPLNFSARLFALCLVALQVLALQAGPRVFRAADLGLVPNTEQDQSPAMQRALMHIQQEMAGQGQATLMLEPGIYHFYPQEAARREYYVSNHDQTNPKHVAIPLEDMEGFTLDGQGAELVCHGRMMPISLVRSQGCTIRNLSIDFHNPHISQIFITDNSPERGITFRTSPEVQYSITSDGRLRAEGLGWGWTPYYGIAFDGNTRHLVYNTSDIATPIVGAEQVAEHTYRVPTWKDARLTPGTVVALRNGERPAPGIFVTYCRNTRVENVRIHYVEGMGLLAQMSENITLDGFSTCLRGPQDPRYFTTQADATHFSGCRGKIESINGLYEGMMDDAINVHGTYLRVVKRIDTHTLEAHYMHPQAWGFDWGYVGDEVQFVASNTMEIVGNANRIAQIETLDKPTPHGASQFRIRFREPLPAELEKEGQFGIENLTWTPQVRFAHNVVRNNRARGALFSTPRRVVVEHNLFDHTSGCAILLCGDCNGWYETGACRDVLIRHNRFVNALTNQFQFTNAVISIYPEIPDLEHQIRPFHGGRRNAIRIVDNEFVTFDAPILYAKSVDGLLFKGNTIVENHDFAPLHWNRHRFFLEHVCNYQIEDITYQRGTVQKEVKKVHIPK